MKDLSLHLMDIIQNSVSAKSTKITVSINADIKRDELEIKIADNGCGMDEDLLKRVLSPFATTRTTRKVGLGIPLLADSARLSGGNLSIDSVKNKGTVLSACFKISHIDRIPMGDMAETMAMVILANPEIEFELNLANNSEVFTLNTWEVKEKLGEVPITNLEVIGWIKDFINSGINSIFGGILNEINS